LDPHDCSTRSDNREIDGAHQETHMAPNNHAMAMPMASAANDSSVITGMDGCGFEPRIISMLCLPAAISGVAGCVECSWAAAAGRTVIMPCFKLYFTSHQFIG